MSVDVGPGSLNTPVDNCVESVQAGDPALIVAWLLAQAEEELALLAVF